MSLLTRRALAWHLVAVTLTAAAAPPAGASACDRATLTLSDAAALAVTAQPLITGLDAQRQAAQASAVAAAQLPDPQLGLGIVDLPIDTNEAYSLTRDSDTQIELSVMQEFPRAEKRRLRGEQLTQEAARLSAEHHLARRSIRLEVTLAWLDVWRFEQELSLVRTLQAEAESQLQAAEIALRTGTTTQAEFLRARQQVNRLEDAAREADQRFEQARSGLSRWIGDAALQPICTDLPPREVVPPLASVVTAVADHPQLAGAAARIAAAEAGSGLARANFSPDWRVAVGYGHRPAFSEMVMLQVGIDLPVFTRNRQDQALTAALAQQQAAEFARQDVHRRLLSQARHSHHDHERLLERLQLYQTRLLPDADAQIQAAQRGWRAGRNGFRDLLDARSAALELRLSALALQHELARSEAQLRYLGAFDAPAGPAEHAHE